MTLVVGVSVDLYSSGSSSGVVNERNNEIVNLPSNPTFAYLTSLEYTLFSCKGEVKQNYSEYLYWCLRH